MRNDVFTAGLFRTQQPVDSYRSRQCLIDDPRYWAQPKRNGVRAIAFASPCGVHWQSRNGHVMTSPARAIDRDLELVACRIRITLDGEIYWLTAGGIECRTKHEALRLGRGRQVAVVFEVFSVIGLGDDDLSVRAESHRIAMAKGLLSGLAALSQNRADRIQVIPTYRTASEKAALCESQRLSGREGEVWKWHDGLYVPGKTSDGRVVRTKYGQSAMAGIWNGSESMACKAG